MAIIATVAKILFGVFPLKFISFIFFHSHSPGFPVALYLSGNLATEKQDLIL